MGNTVVEMIGLHLHIPLFADSVDPSPIPLAARLFSNAMQDMFGRPTTSDTIVEGL